MEENNEEKMYINYKVYAGYEYIVNRNDFNGQAKYNITVIQKTIDGQKIQVHIPVKFKKDVEVLDKTKIKIKQAYENVWYRADDKKHFQPILSIQINDFDIVEESPESHSDEIQQYNNEMQQNNDDMDLPF